MTLKSSLKTKPIPASDALRATSNAQMNIVIVGHVDHGKSTLVGRLLYDTGSLPDGKFEQIKASSEKRGMPFEWSFLMDALQTERDQGITIDTTQIWFSTEKRRYCIIDAPGHKEFLKNMITGAASAEAALLIIDAKEGVKEQSKRHGYLLHLLGIRKVAVAVNKMDLVNYDEKAFSAIEQEYRAYLKSVGVTPTFIIPISARDGVNIISTRNTQHAIPLPWYKGPSILEALDRFEETVPESNLPLRLPVQDVYKFDERRIIAGRIESGSLKVGDEILFSPSGRRVKIASIESWPQTTPVKEASAGQSVGITLSDQIFAERGNIVSHVKNAPALTNLIRAQIFWLGHNPLTVGKRYKMKLSTYETTVEVKDILQTVDTGSLAHSKSTQVERGGVAEILLRVRGLMAVDDHAENARTGRFVLIEDYDVAGGGIISLKGIPDQRVASAEIKSKNISEIDFRITSEQRSLANGHLGGILWFTGLSGSGKSTLALELQQRLFAKGYQVFVLDGDNVRAGLNKDLGFSPEDRTENIRRVGEVAALFARAGIIVITSFISPYKEDRRRARAAAPEHFNTIYIKADVATCEKRDVKGLYKKARLGEIKEFTGISAPYEEPENPDLIIDTASMSVEESVGRLLEYVQKQLVDPVENPEAAQPRDYSGGGI